MLTVLARASLAVLILRSCTCSNGDGTDDPCAENGGCPSHATCSNNNGVAECTCMLGYAEQNDGKCDYNPCLVNPGMCSPGTCNNSFGMQTCSCPAGYRVTGTDGGQTCLANYCGTCPSPNLCVPTPSAWVCQCSANSCGSGETCTVDGGTPVCERPDAGSPDGGTPDAGHGLGAACSPTDGTQSDCEAPLVCLAVGPNGVCTTGPCETGGPGGDWCGSTDGVSNACLWDTSLGSYCAVGCQPDAGDPCGRPDFSCWTGTDYWDNTVSYCAPNCTNHFSCPTDSVCNVELGVCEGECGDAGTCPVGMCQDSSSGGCYVAHAYGETCGGMGVTCEPSSLCVVLNGNDPSDVGECLTECQMDSDCEGGATCSLQVEVQHNMISLCSPPMCEMDGGVECAPGMTCQPYGGRDTYACLPVQM